MSSFRSLLPLLVVFTLTGCGSEPPPDPEPADEPVIQARTGPMVVAAPGAGRGLADIVDAWRSETGEAIRLVDVDTPDREEADLVIFDSVADAWDDAERDGLRPVYSSVVDANVDDTLQDSESRWVALSTRARIVVYHEPSVSDEDLETITSYASLGDERWLGKLCLSSSRHGSNRMLIAFMIRDLGVREAELAVRSWRTNLATNLFTDDDALLAAIAAGDCIVGIADSNRVYAAPATSDIGARWFTVEGATAFDGSVAAVTRHAHDAEAAQRLLEWLTTPTPNALFAIPRLDFAANRGAPSSSTLANLPVEPGEVSAPLSDLAFLLEEADRLRERARYP